MQTFNQSPARDSGINSKVSVPAGKQGKGLGLGGGEAKNDSPVNTDKSVGGFAGGLINPMVKVGK